MKKRYLLLFLLLTYVWGMAQSIENVKFRQTDDDKVVVTFDLISQDGTSYDVKLLVSG